MNISISVRISSDRGTEKDIPYENKCCCLAR